MLKDKIIHQKVLANQVIGLLIGFFVTRFITIPLVGEMHPDMVSIIVPIIFFIASYWRMYLIDWFFKYILKKQ